MALVSVQEHGDNTSRAEDRKATELQGSRGDADMMRAVDLVELHDEVKLKHTKGDDAGLQQALKEVDEVSRALERRSFDRGLN